MKVNLCQLAGPLRNAWTSHLIYNVMTEHTRNASNWEEVFKFDPNNPEVEIAITVNGVEVPFEHFIKELEIQHTSMLAEEAKKMIDANFGTMIETLQKMSDDAQNKLKFDVLPSWDKQNLTT